VSDGALHAPYTERIEPHVADAGRDAAELRRRTEAVARGGARAAVLGVNDGLVTNLALILAMAGADASQSAVRLAGFASLVAGAFSMAAGEWVSVRSQVELYRGILAELRSLVRRNPRLVLGELTTKLEEEGFGTSTAQRVATELPLDERKFFAFAARTLFGMNPDELGAPATAAMVSFVLFSVGALVPLTPWFFAGGTGAAVVSAGLTSVASLAVGAWISRSSGTSVARGGLRQLAIVVAAAGLTYGIGALFGTAVA
jgi:vacuolar iron transporter family protein